MSELNVYHHELRPNEYAEFYLKYEADKVIADLEESHKMEVEQLLMEIVELKQKINEVHTELELWRDGSIISETHQKELDEKRYSDYKRCLAMVRWCEAEMWNIRNTPLCDMNTHEVWQHDDEFWKRWYEHWLELADKFKEAK